MKKWKVSLEIKDRAMPFEALLSQAFSDAETAGRYMYTQKWHGFNTDQGSMFINMDYVISVTLSEMP